MYYVIIRDGRRIFSTLKLKSVKEKNNILKTKHVSLNPESKRKDVNNAIITMFTCL